jgi:diguanylate cyclase (GGDEF)-like protein/PAS domain S-box-containing protein
VDGGYAGMTLPALKDNHKIYIMLALLIGASYLTYYYHVILETDIIFTHLFYIPIALACIWWKRRGIVVAMFFGAMLLIGHALSVSNFPLVNDVFRSLMFVVVAAVVALLSERVERANILYRTVADSSYTGIYIVQDGKFRYLNRNVARHAGYAATQMIGMDSPTVIHPDDREQAGKNAVSMLKGELTTPYEFRIMGKDGQIRYIMETVTPIKYQGKRAVLGNVVDITARQQSEEALDRYREQIKLILESVGDGIYGVDLNGRTAFANPSALRITGYEVGDLVGMDQHAVLHHTKADGSPYPVEECQIKRTLRDGEIRHVADEIFWKKDGMSFPVEYVVTPMIENNRLTGAVVVFKDISDRKRAEDELRISEERYRTILRDIEDGYHEVDLAGSFNFFNESFRKIMGYSREELLGMNYKQYAADRENVKKVREVYNTVYRTGAPVQGFDWDIIRKDGERRTVEVSVSLIRDAEGRPEGFRGIVRDITERKRQEEEIRKLSITDQLTGLYNRRGFIALAEQQMKTSNRAKRQMMLAFIDIDGMKWINDTLGHKEGDRALLDTANILRQTFRESDISARMGGDEFAVLAIDVTDMNPDILSDRLEQIIAAHNTNETRPFRLLMSWGAAIYDPDCLKSLDQLMSEADELMYLRKKAKLRRSS